MARYKLTIEYEGTRYSGWQVQKNARTVQGELIGAVKTVCKSPDFEVMGAGRTDAGVHALAQVAHIDVNTMLAPHILRMKLNDELPADINITNIEKAAPNFHARHDAVARSYIYYISTRRSAFGKRYVWWVKDNLDPAAMSKAGTLFEGMHDFRSFTKDDPKEKSTKVLLDEVRIGQEGALIMIRITASHFLWNMVRQIVGVLVEVGRGNMNGADIERMLRQYSEESRQLTASPSGLFLERIYYKGEKRVDTFKPMIQV